MRDAAGNGDVTDSQITQQIAVLNNSFGGGGGSGAVRHRLLVHAGRHRPLQQQPVAQRPPVARATARRPAGRRQRPEHLAGRLRLPRHRDLPVGLLERPGHRRHPGAVLLAARAARRPTTTSARRPPTRPVTGSGSTTRSRAAARARTTRFRHPGAVQLDQRLPRRARLLLAAGAGPDPQLHGLQLRQLLHQVHRSGQSIADGRRCGRPTAAEPSGSTTSTAPIVQRTACLCNAKR